MPPTICATLRSAFARIAMETCRSPDVVSIYACAWSWGIAGLLLIFERIEAGKQTRADGANPSVHPVPNDAVNRSSHGVIPPESKGLQK